MAIEETGPTRIRQGIETEKIGQFLILALVGKTFTLGKDSSQARLVDFDLSPAVSLPL